MANAKLNHYARFFKERNELIDEHVEATEALQAELRELLAGVRGLYRAEYITAIRSIFFAIATRFAFAMNQLQEPEVRAGNPFVRREV
jgi:recombinational DNA repair ATPase RecF